MHAIGLISTRGPVTRGCCAAVAIGWYIYQLGASPKYKAYRHAIPAPKIDQMTSFNIWSLLFVVTSTLLLMSQLQEVAKPLGRLSKRDIEG